MKKLILLSSLFLLPQMSQAAGNRILHCRSESAELVFHTVMYGAIAVGDYTVVNGQRADLPAGAKSAEGILLFFNQDRIFRIDEAEGPTPLPFKLLAQLFGPEPTVVETGMCEEVKRK